METRNNESEVKTDGNRLTGYAAVYNSPTKITERGRSFLEVIKPGAFKRALESGADVIATFNHDNNQLLGRTSSGTLRLTDTERGLQYEIDLPDTQTGNELRALVARGDIRGASFTFGVRQNGEVWNKERTQRELHDLYLAELGPVVSPAYQATTVALRSLENYKLRIQLAEKL